jgi:hypothetical protein
MRCLNLVIDIFFEYLNARKPSISKAPRREPPAVVTGAVPPSNYCSTLFGSSELPELSLL